MQIENIAVIGAGTMGSSIALAFSMYGYSVNLVDLDKQALQLARQRIANDVQLMIEEGVLESQRQGDIEKNITYYTELQGAVSDRDYIIEAVIENLQIKQKIFEDLDRYAPEECILATNTSSLKLEEIGKHLSEKRKPYLMINHWFNPAHIMPIVELSYFGNTSDQVYNAVDKLYASLKKQRIKVYRDVPGLVGTRLQQCLAREVYYLLEEGIVNEEDVDKAIKYGPSFRHVTSGLLEVCDMGGIDIWYAVADNLFAELSNASKANDLLRTKVEQGHLGIKSGKGFYEYEADQLDQIKENFQRKLLKQLKVMDL